MSGGGARDGRSIATAAAAAALGDAPVIVIMGALQAAAALHVVTGEALGIAAAGIAVSTLDDCFIDFVFLALTVRRRGRRQVAAEIADACGWMAIMIPAWDEAAVIGAMLRDLTARLDYPRFRVFVGTYPNDRATFDAVAAVGDPRIAITVVDRPGPTTKADCLNALWHAIVAYEDAGIM